MGSKRKIATQIVSKIVADNPGIKYFYDLFGGGGSISAAMLRHRDVFMEHRPQVFYNEKNPAIVALMQKLKDGVTLDELTGWVSKEEHKEKSNQETWDSALCQICWSFGSDQTGGYLYGTDIKGYKTEYHNALVDPSRGVSLLCEEIKKRTGFDIRLTTKNTGLFDMYHELHHQINQTTGNTSLAMLEHLGRIKRVFDYRSVATSSRFNISNLSYENVKIDTPIDQTVIYLDPPYRNTSGYANDIDHERLDQWVINNPYKVYVSEYEFPGLKPILSIEKRSTVVDNSKVATEHLFCNRS